LYLKLDVGLYYDVGPFVTKRNLRESRNTKKKYNGRKGNGVV